MQKVLVVDDELISSMVLSHTLSAEGFEVRTAASGEDAIKIGLDFRPDVLVSDWKLSKAADGIEVARALQAHHPKIQIILCSGFPSNEIESRSGDIRVFKILEKPCGAKEISTLVHTALKNEH